MSFGFVGLVFFIQRMREGKNTLSTGKTGKFEMGPMKDKNHGSLQYNLIVLIFRRLCIFL